MGQVAYRRKARRQQLAVLLVTLLIILASVGSTLYLTGVLAPEPRQAAARVSSGYRNTTFTDAHLECESYTRERYAARLQSIVSDSHSSRYEDGDKLYKIFLKLQMRKSPDAPLPEPYWVNCFVSAENGRITHYRVGEAKDAPVRPLRREQGGAAGWR